LSAELSVIYTNVQKVLDLRHKYLRVSLQGGSGNPNDDPSWKIYPPPPPPVWVEDPAKTVGFQTPNEVADPTATEKSFWAGSEKGKERTYRKPGEDIGEDFIYDEVEIPGEDEMVFRLDDKGVYQVYENKKGMHCPLGLDPGSA